MAWKKYSHLIILFLCCIPLFFINIHENHPYGDDWAQYLKEALNIAQGLPWYRSGYIFNPLSFEYAPPHYPPGYSLLLAPVVYFTKTSIIPLLYVNTVLVCGMMFAAYAYFTAKTSKTIALCLALVFTYLSIVIDLKGQILSDIACTFFVISYFAVRSHIKVWNNKKVILLIIFCLFAVLVRTQSILIIFAELVLVFRNYIFKKDKEQMSLKVAPGLLISVGVLLCFLLLNLTILQTPDSSISFYKNIYTKVLWSKDLWQLIGYNLNYILGLFNEILYHTMNDFFFSFFVTIITTCSFGLFLLGTIVSLRKKLEIEVLFLGMMILLILITPVYQGLRYLLPAVPVYLWMVAKGMNAVLPLIGIKQINFVAIGCTIVFLSLEFDDYERCSKGFITNGLKANDTLAFKYINDNVKDDEIIFFPKPRLLTLYTDKKSMVISPTATVEESQHQLDSMKVKYLLSCSYLNVPALTNYLNSSPKKYSDSTIINSDYILYTLIRR